MGLNPINSLSFLFIYLLIYLFTYTSIYLRNYSFLFLSSVLNQIRFCYWVFSGVRETIRIVFRGKGGYPFFFLFSWRGDYPFCFVYLCCLPVTTVLKAEMFLSSPIPPTSFREGLIAIIACMQWKRFLSAIYVKSALIWGFSTKTTQ